MLCWEREGKFLSLEDLGDRKSNLNWIHRPKRMKNHLIMAQVSVMQIVDAMQGYFPRNFRRQWQEEMEEGHDMIQETVLLLQNMLYNVATQEVIDCYILELAG